MEKDMVDTLIDSSIVSAPMAFINQNFYQEN